MHLNEGIAISTDHILLVPYEARHVLTYHKWMTDPSLQAATASEPLSLDEEYAMQESWRTDGDKLTFIVCEPLSKDQTASRIYARVHDAEEKMLGDVNLFITPSEDDPDVLVGECELMIAESAMQGKGYGRSALLAFLKYVTMYEEQILQEYRAWIGHAFSQQSSAVEGEKSIIGGRGERIVGSKRLGYLRVRINKDNIRSISLFEHAGFKLLSKEPNYFGELEMRMNGHFLGEDDKQFTREWWGGSWRVNGWKSLNYATGTANT